MTTIPEAPETIEAQLEWLAQGKRAAVLLTPGCVLPEIPSGLAAMLIPEGLLLYAMFPTDDDRLTCWQRGQISLPELLGYGTEEKPEELANASVVVVRDGITGHEKQAAVTTPERLDEARAAAHAVADAGDTVTVENGVRVCADRLRSLDARELKVRPYHPEHDATALEAAAAADAHGPLNPTHVIERHGEIIGYFGVNSLPLFRLWFHSAKMKAGDSTRLLFMMENHYRMAGVDVLGTIINTTSPFYPVAARGGYVENLGDRLFLKEL
jgi:hypothetical protein